jgi:primosomal protein N'
MATARLLRHKVYAQGLADVDVIGPAPGVPARLRGRYRWHLTLRGRDLHQLLEGVDFPPGCTVDVDPVDLL